MSQRSPFIFRCDFQSRDKTLHLLWTYTALTIYQWKRIINEKHIITYIIVSSHFFHMCLQSPYLKRTLEKLSGKNQLPFSHEVLCFLILFLRCFQPVSTKFQMFISNIFLRCWLFYDFLAPCSLPFC